MHAEAIDYNQFGLRVLQHAPVVILVLDLEGRIQHVNPFFERLTGYRLDEVRGRDWFDTFLPERDRERIRALFGQSRAGEHVRGSVNPIVTRAGEERQIEWTDEFLRDSEGRAGGILAIGQDVTERLAVEFQHRSVVAAMHDGVVVQGVNGEIIDCNRAAERMLGLSADQMAGCTSLDPRWRCVHEDGTPFPGETHPAMVTLRTGAPTGGVVMGVYRSDGDLVWLSINSEPLRRPGDHAVVGAVTSFTDITERKRAEATLVATERWFALVLDNVTDGFFTLDREWRYVHINPAGARMVGRTPKELVGRVLYEVFPEATGTIWDRTYRQVMNTGEAATAEEYYEPLDQWFEASVFPVADGISVFFRDISIRKQAERSLRDERDRLRQIFDAQFGFIAEFACDGTVIEVNQTPLTLMGLQRDEVLGRKFWEVGWLAPGTEPGVRAAIEAAARGEIWRGDIIANFPGLGRRDVDAVFSSLRDADGSVRSVIGVGVDITERKQGEERLQQAQSLAHVGSWELDFATDRLWWSDETFRLLGLDRGVQQPTYEAYLGAVHPDDRALVETTFRRSLEQRESYDLEHRVLTSGGKVKHVRAQVRSSFDQDGTPRRSEGTLQDVTDLLAAEEGMRDREARLAVVFSHTSDAMLLLSVDADGTLRVAAANQSLVNRLRRIKAITEADLLGITFEELILEVYGRPPDILAQYQESLRRAIDTRAPLTFEHSAIFPTGRLFAEVSLVPVLDGAGACVQVLWSSRDVTARTQADAQIRASLAEKETLLREIHHRVKNNLQVIASLLHFQGKKLRTPEDAVLLAELRQRIFAMTLVHERLYQSPDVARVDFGDYVRALVAELGRSFGLRPGIRIDVTTDDVRLPIELALPSGMLMSELVTNVLKYAFPEGRKGTATVSVRAVEGRIVVGVDDDGVGFPDGFDPGARNSFGWELVRTLVLQLDGTIEVRTDRGAHVRVSFPVPAAAEESAS